MASQESKSKRQSDGKPEQSRLEEVVIFLDENLHNCKPILECLWICNLRYERHRDYFVTGTYDDVWLPFVGERGWTVLTKDKKNRYNELEKTAIRSHKVAEFYFASGNMNRFEMAAALEKALPDLKRKCASLDLPFIGSITKSGVINILEDCHGSTHERRREKTRAAKNPS